jgi:hypothetical protein
MEFVFWNEGGYIKKEAPEFKNMIVTRDVDAHCITSSTH